MTKSHHLPRAILVVAMTASGCATSAITVVSRPEGATVTRISTDGRSTSLGKTPLEIAPSTLPGGDAVRLRITADGHTPENILLNKTMLPSVQTISIDLTAVATPTVSDTASSTNITERTVTVKCPEPTGMPPDKVAGLARGIAEVQGLVSKRSYEQAESRLRMLTADHPSLPVLYDLQGNVFYLQRRYAEALRAYERSLALDGANPDTARMAERLRGR